MAKEIFVEGILEEIEAAGYDRKRTASWLELFSTMAAPFRYPGHALMMIRRLCRTNGTRGAHRCRRCISGRR
jgi:hypothetical protein